MRFGCQFGRLAISPILCSLDFILFVQFGALLRACAYLLPERFIANVRTMTQIADHSTHLSNDPLDRAVQLLGMAREELERAQGGAGLHLEDALVAAEDTIDEQLAKILAARAADEDDAEATGDADRRRRAWFPTYRAV